MTRMLRLVGLVVFTAFLGVKTYAADRTWDGGATTNVWSDALNWDGDTNAPVTGDGLFFSGLLNTSYASAASLNSKAALMYLT